MLSSAILDPRIGQAAGFGGIILHGLSTFGFAARALLKAVANNDPTALKYFGVRFTSPVKPGDALETQIWEVGPGPDGTTEVTFITKNLNSGKVCHSQSAGSETNHPPFRLLWAMAARLSRRPLAASSKRMEFPYYCPFVFLALRNPNLL